MGLPVEIDPLLIASSATGYTVNNSLRFRASASAYLNRTFGTATNTLIWTYSAWVKRGTLAITPYLIEGYSNSTNRAGLAFNSNDTLTFFYESGGSVVQNLTTTQVFRDPSAWYHIVIAYDATQATASNRTKLYVNGVQVTAFSTATYGLLNQATWINTSGAGHYLGASIVGAGYYLDGYLAEVNFIDGQALTPTSFGAYSTTTGVWQPIKYTGTYGTNGFYLPFSNTTSTTTLGYDFSGNSNNWTTNNISLTAGATYDAMVDSPTLSATASNYCTWNPLDNSSTLSNGNLTVSAGSSQGVTGTIGIPTGSWYWEVTATTVVTNQTLIGMIATNQANSVRNLTAAGIRVLARNDGAIILDSSTPQTGLTTWSNGDIIACAFNATSNSIQFYRNGSTYGSAVTVDSGYTYVPYCGSTAATSVFNGNFGQRTFSYTPPSGYSALNTYNFPTPSIANGALYNSATLYTGNGNNVANALVVNNGANNTLNKSFYPDFVWIKDRTNANTHVLQDSVRGTAYFLQSNSTAADSATGGGDVSSFNSNGFTISYNNTRDNANGDNYVAWQWNAGSGVSGSNTSGSITSTVSVNQTAGFSVVTYTGTGVAATIGHGLGSAPSMIIVKARNTTGDWSVYNSNIGNTSYLLLDGTAGTASSTTKWASTTPSSSVFSVGIDTTTNMLATTYVAYCFAPIAGYSAFGSYTGNGSTDGPFVYCGFRPRWIMIKRTDSVSAWLLKDTSRDVANVATDTLYPNLNNAETTAAADTDILSNGFKCRSTGSGDLNSSGGTYIYAAFAENPFKYALAR